MTADKAATVAGIVINSGYPVIVKQRADASWEVSVRAISGGGIPIGPANALAEAQSITGVITDIVYH